ncbi:MAG: hypothetical protein FWF92_01620 [Oscillospiraceae bacterium]|nr:hypothetical protein [Oscillospiraceae bacterium]
MKNIIIWGVPRSGKSTLSYMIRQELGHSVIPMDGIKSVYDVVRPDDKISAPEMTDYGEAKLMAKMIIRLIQILSWGNARGEFHVYEGVSFDFDTILSGLPKDKFPVSLDNFIIICMGYTEILPEEKLKEMALYETPKDWNYKMSTETIMAHCITFCNESKFVKETAGRLGLKYFDVSFDRDKIFLEIIRYIKQNIS